MRKGRQTKTKQQKRRPYPTVTATFHSCVGFVCFALFPRFRTWVQCLMGAGDGHASPRPSFCNSQRNRIDLYPHQHSASRMNKLSRISSNVMVCCFCHFADAYQGKWNSGLQKYSCLFARLRQFLINLLPSEFLESRIDPVSLELACALEYFFPPLS